MSGRRAGSRGGHEVALRRFETGRGVGERQVDPVDGNMSIMARWARAPTAEPLEPGSEVATVEHGHRHPDERGALRHALHAHAIKLAVADSGCLGVVSARILRRRGAEPARLRRGLVVTSPALSFDRHAPIVRLVRIVLSLTLMGAPVGLAACGDGGQAGGSGEDRPQVVVTTSILGDIVSEVVGAQAEVEVVMPLGTDPHEFQTSARQVEDMTEADLLVINGAGFEEGMLDVIETAAESGTPVFAFADHVDLLPWTGQHEEDGPPVDGDHGAASGEEYEDAGHDPHIWTDPARMITALEAFGERAADLVGVDPQAVASQTADYVARLEALDAEIEHTLASVPADRRTLVTNHEVFHYFATRLVVSDGMTAPTISNP